MINKDQAEYIAFKFYNITFNVMFGIIFNPLHWRLFKPFKEKVSGSNECNVTGIRIIFFQIEIPYRFK